MNIKYNMETVVDKMEIGHTQGIAIMLSRLLADEFVLQLKTKKAHWNVEGIDFKEKHELFEDQFQELEKIVDTVAERIRIIGHYAPATLKEYLHLSQLTENSRSENDGQGFIAELLSDHQGILIYLKTRLGSIGADFNDIGNVSFLTSLVEFHEKMIWVLRSHLAE